MKGGKEPVRRPNKEVSPMLRLSLLPDEYLSIGDGRVIVQVVRVAGGRADLRIAADRSIPVVRGTVLERAGAPRPDCLTPPPKRKPRQQRDLFYAWNDDRERAVRAMQRVIGQLEQKGDCAEADQLRTQLKRLVPDVWEDEVPAPHGKQTPAAP